MKITIRNLRNLIQETLSEAYPYIHDAVGPSTADREQIGSLADDGDKEPEDKLPPHLREPTIDPEDVRGPIPASDDPVTILSDPYANDYQPTATRFRR